MLVTLRNISAYLLSKDLISERSIVDGDLLISDVSGRNRNFKVVRQRAPSYFVKQISHFDPQSIAMLQCEAACYWLAQNDPEYSALRRIVPHLVAFDLERQILVTELLPGAENLGTRLQRLQDDQITLARRLGECLGDYHNQLSRTLTGVTNTAIFPRQVPWILSADRRNSGPFKKLTSGTAELLDLVDRTPVLFEGLRKISDAWNADTLIHGDMRLSNIVLGEVSSGEPAVLLVDWELCDIGDKRWDLGALTQAFLSFAVASQSPGLRTTALKHDTWLSEKFLRIPAAFWAGYCSSTCISRADRPWFVSECLEFAAARLIQSAYEYLQLAPAFSCGAQAMIQLSLEVFRSPHEMARSLSE